MAEAPRYFSVDSYEKDGSQGQKLIVFVEGGQECLSDSIREAVFSARPATSDYYIEELTGRDARAADRSRRVTQIVHPVLSHHLLIAQSNQAAQL